MESLNLEEKIHGKPDIRGHKIKPSKGKLLPKVFKKLERLVQSAKNVYVFKIGVALCRFLKIRSTMESLISEDKIHGKPDIGGRIRIT
jgi:hypothetical protein